MRETKLRVASAPPSDNEGLQILPFGSMNLRINREGVRQALAVMKDDVEHNGYAYSFEAACDYADGRADPNYMRSEVRCIYGRGGYNRYFVHDDGSVEYSTIHGTPEGIAAARRLGFLIRDDE